MTLLDFGMTIFCWKKANCGSAGSGGGAVAEQCSESGTTDIATEQNACILPGTARNKIKIGEIMGFKDIFKKSFIQGFTRYDATPENIIVVFLIAGFFALYIFFAYRLLTRRTFYSKSFNIALPALVMITAGVILTIQSSVVISLGMVGALSIVRFRTAIKDPMDLVFLFWAISTGIICGAGLAQISCVLAFILTVALFVFDRIPVAKAPKILMVSGSGYELEEKIMSIVKEFCKYYTVKSRALSNGKVNLVVEIRSKDDSALLQKVAKTENVASSTILAHDGEVTY